MWQILLLNSIQFLLVVVKVVYIEFEDPLESSIPAAFNLLSHQPPPPPPSSPLLCPLHRPLPLLHLYPCHLRPPPTLVYSTTTFLPFPLPLLLPFASPPPPSSPPSASSHAGPLCYHLPPLSFTRSTVLHLSSMSIPTTFGLLPCRSPQPPPSFTLLHPLCHPPPLLYFRPRCLRPLPTPASSTTTFLPSAPFAALALSSTSVLAAFGFLQCCPPLPPPSSPLLPSLHLSLPLLHLHPHQLRSPPASIPLAATFLPSLSPPLLPSSSPPPPSLPPSASSRTNPSATIFLPSPSPPSPPLPSASSHAGPLHHHLLSLSFAPSTTNMEKHHLPNHGIET